MEQIITVARVQQPQPGKKQVAVYDTNDQRWGVSQEDGNSFIPGVTYKVWDWKTSNFQGREYRTIQSGNFQQVGGVAALNVVQRPQQGRAPAPTGFDDTMRRRDIFVCGALNNLLSNPSEGQRFFREDGTLDGKFTTETVWKLRKVFDYSLGPAAQDPSITTAPVGREATPQQQAEASLGYGRVADFSPPAPSNKEDMDDDEIPF